MILSKLKFFKTWNQFKDGDVYVIPQLTKYMSVGDIIEQNI